MYSRQHNIERFTISMAWLTPLRSAFYAAFGALYSLGSNLTLVKLFEFPWDDSTVAQKFMTCSGTLVFAAAYGLVGIIFLVAAFQTWAGPHTLIFDGKGGLILRSVARDLRIAVVDIKTIELDQTTDDDGNSASLVIWTGLVDGKLTLPRFAKRVKFLQVLKAAHPAIDVVVAQP